MSILTLENVSVDREGKRVLDDISFELRTGRITALIGPNGGGKSSLVLALSGLIPVVSGRVTLDEADLHNRRPDLIRSSGLAAVPEGHRVLSRLTVEENLNAAGFGLSRQDCADAVAGVYEVFPELVKLSSQQAGRLSGGQQQMVALGQALVTRPKFLLADEMSLGLAPLIVKRLMKVLVELAERGTGVLLIEQFTHVALAVSEDVHVLSRGRLRYSGNPQTLRDQPELLHSAYLS